jgi:NAD(P)-dependent dehydrogenase (short-subunit alcohol dehydrogenase family)
MSDRLKGKRIMVTGAAQGIGLAIAEMFLSEGAALFLVDRDGPLLEMKAKRLQREGRALAYAEADITDADAIEAVVSAAASSIAPINALVNNAGVNVFSEPLEMSDADWQRCFDIDGRRDRPRRRLHDLRRVPFHERDLPDGGWRPQRPASSGLSLPSAAGRYRRSE